MAVWSGAATPKGSAGTPRRGRRGGTLKCGTESYRAPGGLIQTGRKGLLPRAGEVLRSVPCKSPQPTLPWIARQGLLSLAHDVVMPGLQPTDLVGTGRLGHCSGWVGPGAPPEMASRCATLLSSLPLLCAPAGFIHALGSDRAGLSGYWRASGLMPKLGCPRPVERNHSNLRGNIG